MIPMTMQVQIRHLKGGDVSINDCAQFSQPMSEAIEASDLLKEAYVLEISSPGIGENLQTDRDFLTFKGFPVEVSFRNHEGTTLNQTGLLQKRSQDNIHLNIKGRIKRIPREDVICVSLTSPTS